MSLIHLQNEVVFQRDLDNKSWSTYVSYNLDEESSEIIAETISIFHNRDRPHESYRKCRIRFQVPLDQVPRALVRQVEEVLDLSCPARDTTTMFRSDTTVF